MTQDILIKILIGFIGALIAISIEVVIDYFKKRIELNLIKKILVNDLYHQLICSAYFRIELVKLNNIYLEGLDSLENKKLIKF